MNHTQKKFGLRLLCAVLILAVLTGCTAPAKKSQAQIYSVNYLDVFDTVTTVMGSAESEEAFQEHARQIHEQLLHLHKLFDIYHNYDGISNLKTVNDQAGIAPVKVEEPILSLLLDCQEYEQVTAGKVNAAMGSVLSLWHDARSAGIESPETAHLPDAEALQEAAQHTNFDNVIINEEECTVYLADPQLRLDVGAIAKGWAAQRVAENVPEGILLSVGGNVLATGAKFPDGTPWTVGVQNPDGDGDSYVAAVPLTKGSMVTSGDYQRFFTVDGVRYHHIIDPDTLFPATRWRSVTILCPNSGLADMLSTALFLLSQEDGQALLDHFGAEALWIDHEGTLLRSAGFPDA